MLSNCVSQVNWPTVIEKIRGHTNQLGAAFAGHRIHVANRIHPAAAILEYADHLKRLFVGTAVNQFRLKAGFAPIGEHAQERLVAFDEWNAKNVDAQMGHDAIESPAH